MNLLNSWNIDLQTQSFGGCFSLWVWRQKHEWAKGLVWKVFFHRYGMEGSLVSPVYVHVYQKKIEKPISLWTTMNGLTRDVYFSPSPCEPKLLCSSPGSPGTDLAIPLAFGGQSGVKVQSLWKGWNRVNITYEKFSPGETNYSITILFETVASMCQMAIPIGAFWLYNIC